MLILWLSVVFTILNVQSVSAGRSLMQYHVMEKVTALAFSRKTHNNQIGILSDLSADKTIALQSRPLLSGVWYHEIPEEMFSSLRAYAKMYYLWQRK